MSSSPPLPRHRLFYTYLPSQIHGQRTPKAWLEQLMKPASDIRNMVTKTYDVNSNIVEQRFLVESSIVR